MHPTNAPSPAPPKPVLCGRSAPPLTRDERAADFAFRGAVLFFAVAVVLFFSGPMLMIYLAPVDHRSLGRVILWVLLVPAVPQVAAVWEAGVGWRHGRARWGGTLAVFHVLLALWLFFGICAKARTGAG